MATGSKLNGTLRAFIARQPMFFVATAAPSGRVNVSPKGAATLRVLDDQRIMWLNLSGSGNETAGHLKALNRMTLMFCAFEGEAMILRVYGAAQTLHPRDPGWAEAAARFQALEGARQIFDLKIDLVQTSCGTGVPVMRHEKDRVEDELVPFFREMGPEGVAAYWRKKNTETLDGFPTGLFED